MGEFKVGDIVIRKSYGGDIYFKIIQINKSLEKGQIYILKGTNVRLVADSLGSDLEKPSLDRISSNEEIFNNKVNAAIRKALIARKSSKKVAFRASTILRSESEETSGRPGKVLHIDGDEEYLNVCLKGYSKLKIDCVGKFVPEVKQMEVVKEILEEYRPDILVLTGHDGMIKGTQNVKSLDSYRNSRYFIEAVKKAREYEKSYDDLIIFAGACQSFYEALIDSGANYASSPGRVLIHAMDPVLVCEKVAFSSIGKLVSPQEIMENTITGSKGIGGLETRGKYRELSPVSNLSDG
ncbi:MAG TPA: sporulation peptidase YabG [Clostridiaceae bacterium]|jgi:spore coat assembly protein|nr:sporulation peptidase YabG [Clostridiaceae bacterium]HBN27721.1 sporulation peptidase YabG [Clostridiaceae bacterium]HCL50021.1 sporulation peptidase YabG [Clostridiaceae bacterium]